MREGGTETCTRAWYRPFSYPTGISPIRRSTGEAFAVGAAYAERTRAVRRDDSLWITRRPRAVALTLGRFTTTDTTSGLSSGQPRGSKLRRYTHERSSRICVVILAGVTPLMKWRPPVSAAIVTRVACESLILWMLSCGFSIPPVTDIFEFLPSDWMNVVGPSSPCPSTV